MSVKVDFSLTFTGARADNHLLDFYDAADALSGFQRSLALTVHLVLNGEVLVHAPAIRGAEILLKSPEAGSWKVIATVGMLMSGLHVLGTAPRDTVYGNLATSLYDYVVKESLGFHVDFDSTIGKQYEELRGKSKAEVPKISQSQADSLIEKIENSVKEMHRPIYGSETALRADLTARFRRQTLNLCTLDKETYSYIHFTTQSEKPSIFFGKVSSYNINTFSGRVYIGNEQRPIPFVLGDGLRDAGQVRKITRSLSMNALDRTLDTSLLKFSAFRFDSNSGRLKRLLITEIH